MKEPSSRSLLHSVRSPSFRAAAPRHGPAPSAAPFASLRSFRNHRGRFLSEERSDETKGAERGHPTFFR
jgi:hypothetical protein